uniref:Uncharacterized protein n=1 Tax=Rhizophora mucronata TaxID=61149 RepID=A0A2P2PHD1_RHIMU
MHNWSFQSIFTSWLSICYGRYRQISNGNLNMLTDG